jgi:hypothetical protein
MSVTIFGILNIAVGLISLMGALLSNMFNGSDFTAATPSLPPFFTSMLALWKALSADPLYMVWRRLTIPLDVASGAVLAAAGVGLLLLRHWSRLASIACAIYRILFVGVDSAVLFLVLRHIQAGPHAGDSAQLAIVIGGSLVGAALTLAYPVLLIFFLTRPKAALAFQPGPAPPA